MWLRPPEEIYLFLQCTSRTLSQMSTCAHRCNYVQGSWHLTRVSLLTLHPMILGATNHLNAKVNRIPVKSHHSEVDKMRACPLIHWCYPITWPQSSVACAQKHMSPFCSHTCCCLHALCSSPQGWAAYVASIVQLHFFHHSPRIKI